ncbi:hypothetical protein T484DRAFT_1813941 [Baffinella frigidus]|nr:hypothetical protein T484DRAFT_1813941 [Cryptophyta sp. CCMP2293]
MADEEGYRHGVEIAGQEDFMTVSLEKSDGVLSMVEAAMAGAGRGAEEVYIKMSSSDLSIWKKAGRMFVSPGKDSLVIMCAVPEERKGAASAKEWLGAVLAACGGKVVSQDECAATGVCEAGGGVFKTPGGKTFDKAEALGFEVTAASVEWLRGKGLFPAKVEDDEDDFIPEW